LVAGKPARGLAPQVKGGVAIKRTYLGLALLAALATGVLSVVCFLSLGNIARHLAAGDYPSQPVWETTVFLALLAVNAALFAYGHVSVVRSIRRTRFG
jgi:hypothetical protein